MREVTGRLFVGRHEDADILAVLQFCMGGMRLTSARRWDFLAQGEPELTIHFEKGGAIARIDTALSNQRISEIAAEIDSKLLPTGTKWARRFLFSLSELKGDWTSDLFSLRPAPIGAARANTLINVHPMIMEYRFESVSDPLLSSMRRERRGRRLELLLGALTIGVVRQEFAQHTGWGIAMVGRKESPPAPELFQHAYWLDGFLPEADDPMQFNGREVNRVGDEDFYNFGTNGGEFELPQSMDILVCAWSMLDLPNQAIFLRSAYWLREAHERFSLSRSVALIASVQAVEALLPEVEPSPCACCGQPVYSVTRRFREFLEHHGGGNSKAHTALYAMRSKLTHGADLLEADVDYSFGATSPISQDQTMVLRGAISSAQIAAVNWLSQR